MSSYFEFKRFEEAAARLGLNIGSSKFGGRDVALYPDEKVWSAYSPDVEIWSGDIDTSLAYILGMERALAYVQHLGFDRAKAEEKHREKIRRLRAEHEKTRTMAILKNSKDPGDFAEPKIIE